MNGFEIGLDGRYYISLWVVLQLLILLWPLPHRHHVRLRMAVGGLVLLLIGRGLLLLQSYVISVPLLIRTLMGAAAALLALFCCQVRPLQAAYAAIWATMTQQTLQNASSVLLNLLREAGIQIPYWLYLLCWMAVTLPLGYHLLGRPLFGGGYMPGRRHLAVVAALFVEFELVQGVPDIKILQDGASGLGQNYQFILMNGICLLVAMYLVHTVFVKRQTEAELAVANALRQSQKERYETAKRNVALINHRCHELKMQLASLRRARTASEQQQCLTRLSEAVDIYDSRLATGNDVLDMVLAEQGLYCRERGVQLHCVADGAQLNFLEDADLYVLCTGILQQAIGQTAALPDPQQRELDVAVYRRQGMVVLETAGMLPAGAVPAAPALPQGLDGILQKYDAGLFAGVEHGSAVLRCLIPAVYAEKTE